jgi:hypothetical protein
MTHSSDRRRAVSKALVFGNFNKELVPRIPGAADEVANIGINIRLKIFFGLAPFHAHSHAARFK